MRANSAPRAGACGQQDHGAWACDAVFMCPDRLPLSLPSWPCAYEGSKGVQRAPLGAQTVENLPAMQETQVQSLGREDPLEKGIATHSSILAWRVPWTEEPGGLQSMGLQRVGHDWMTHTDTHTHTHTHTHTCSGRWKMLRTSTDFLSGKDAVAGILSTAAAAC